MRCQKFKKSIPDAYSPKACKLFYAHGCQVHGHFVFVDAVNAPNSVPSTSTTAQAPITGYMKPCPYLALEKTGSDCNFYGQRYSQLESNFEKLKASILRDCCHLVDTIEVVYQCEFEAAARTPGTKEYLFFNHGNLKVNSKPPPQMAVRDGLRGGCVELYSLKAEADHDHDVSYFDINSLYPFICLKNKFVVGPGIHLLGSKMLGRLRLDTVKGCFMYHDPLEKEERECDGIIQVKISIDRNNHSLSQFPFLPIRIKETGSDKMKTYRAACFQCLKDKNKNLCQHDMAQRTWRDTYTCIEVAYAVV